MAAAVGETSEERPGLQRKFWAYKQAFSDRSVLNVSALSPPDIQCFGG